MISLKICFTGIRATAFASLKHLPARRAARLQSNASYKAGKFRG